MTLSKRLKNVSYAYFKRFFENPTASNYSVLSQPLLFPFLADFSRDGLIVSIPPHSVRIQVGVGGTPVPECGAQSKQTIYARCQNLLTGMIEQKKYFKFWRSPIDFNR